MSIIKKMIRKLFFKIKSRPLFPLEDDNNEIKIIFLVLFDIGSYYFDIGSYYKVNLVQGDA
jgi:hypothetical protein